MTKFAETIWKSGCLEEGDTVVVGFSGGADSLALLAGLMELAPQKNLFVTACHVHHGIRGDEADQDAASSEQMAKRLGAAFVLAKVDAPVYAEEHGLGLEEAARILRYRAFEDAADAVGKKTAEAQGENPANRGYAKNTSCVKVATAHTKSDYAETVLMRILRGTGPDGLAAMSFVSGWPFSGTDRTPAGNEREKDTAGGRQLLLIRPLLGVTAEETRAFCDAIGMIPRNDSTNEDRAYLRNRIRLELMPLLKREYNPAVEDGLVRLGSLAAESKSLLDDATETTFSSVLSDKAGKAEDIKNNRELRLDRKKLLALPQAMTKRILAKGLRDIGMEKDLSRVTLDSAYKLLATGKGAGEAEFAGGYRMKLAHGEVILYHGFTQNR